MIQGTTRSVTAIKMPAPITAHGQPKPIAVVAEVLNDDGFEGAYTARNAGAVAASGV